MTMAKKQHGFTEVIAAAVPVGVNAKIDEIVVREGSTKSQWIRTAILKRLDAERSASRPARKQEAA